MNKSNVKVFDPRAIAIVLASPFAVFLLVLVACGPIFIWQQFKYPKGSMWYKANDNPPANVSK